MTPFVAAWAVVWCRNPAPVAIGFRAVGPPIIDAKAGQLSAGMGDSRSGDSGTGLMTVSPGSDSARFCAYSRLREMLASTLA
jgi:hypothetical protein